MGQLDTHIRVKLVGSSKAEPGSSIFTSSGVFTVPKGVKEIEAFLVGGGGNGASVGPSYSPPAGGGGGGYTNTIKTSVAPEDLISISIGSSEGITSILSYEALQGNSGSAGAANNITGGHGGNGGSGGGGGVSFVAARSSMVVYCGNGGYDGSNGGNGFYTSANIIIYGTGGTGQGTTTRAFGESEGTLYAGGGGGGCLIKGSNSSDIFYKDGYGGAGGGGNGSIQYRNPSNGDANTGGGGGGVCYFQTYIPATTGGSGIAIIRWGH